MNKYLKQLLEARKAKQDLIGEKLTKSLDGGTTPDSAVESEISSLESEIAEIEKNIARVEKQIKAAADAEINAQIISKDFVKPEIDAKDIEIQKGMGFVHAVMASASAAIINRKGGSTSTLEVLKTFKTSKVVGDYIKQKAIGTTTDASFAKPLVNVNVASEFIDLLRPQTILGKLTGFYEVPFNTKMPIQTGGATVGFVGETNRKPNGGLTFTDVTLTHAKVAGIVVLSDELVRFSAPKADAAVMKSLRDDIAGHLDTAFLDENQAETDATPAGIINGVTPITPSGQTAADFDADLNKAIDEFLSVDEDIDGAFWIMSPSMSNRISGVRDSLGRKYFDGMEGASKTLLGIPVVTSGSAGSKVVLVKPENILLADDEVIEYDVSSQATITIGEEQVNLFERNLTAIRAERFIRWKAYRKAAAWINYAPPAQEG